MSRPCESWSRKTPRLPLNEDTMKDYIKQALFILAVVGIAKYVNNALPNHPLDKLIAD